MSPLIPLTIEKCVFSFAGLWPCLRAPACPEGGRDIDQVNSMLWIDLYLFLKHWKTSKLLLAFLIMIIFINCYHNHGHGLSDHDDGHQHQAWVLVSWSIRTDLSNFLWLQDAHDHAWVTGDLDDLTMINCYNSHDSNDYSHDHDDGQVSEVLESRNSKFPPASHVLAYTGWRELAVVRHCYCHYRHCHHHHRPHCHHRHGHHHQKGFWSQWWFPVFNSNVHTLGWP